MRHLPVPRSRRGRLLVAAVALAVVLGGAAAGATLALTAHGHSLARASFPGFQLSFRYPSAWTREDWCWLGTSVFPITLLTTANSAPRCQPGTVFAGGIPLPPLQHLGSDGVTVWWIASNQPGLAVARPNTRIGGRPARITVRREPTRRTVRSYVNCVGTGATQRLLSAVIQGPSSNIHQVQVGAVICGPDFAAGEADVRRMLASASFTH